MDLPFSGIKTQFAVIIIVKITAMILILWERIYNIISY